MAVIIFILSFLFLVVIDLKKKKKPFDEQKKKFSIRKDWFITQWDDCLAWFVGGALGALLSNELAIPIINKYLDWPVLAEGMIDLTSIMICTLLGAKIFEKVFALV